MEQQKLPNVTIALVLVILAYLCCCIWGIPAMLLGLIAFILLRNDERTYLENPQNYSNYNTLKTVKILAIIAIAVGALTLIYVFYTINTMGGWEAYIEKSQEMMKQWDLE